MGIIKAAINAVGGGLADQWLEVLEPSPMKDTTVFAPGQSVSTNDKRATNKKGTGNTVSNGSLIHVYDNQMMILTDGGKVVDYTAEPGYYKVENSSLPSMFSGQFGDSIKETFNRIKYGGVTPTSQRVFYLNLQEIKGIKFGTANPINYYDTFYDAELSLRAHGTYSIKLEDPFKFYSEAIPKDAVTGNRTVDIADINLQYMTEFVEALGAAINQMSADGERISFVKSKQSVVSKYMMEHLDDSWREMRGMVVQSVGLEISYDTDSQELIKMRNQGAMLKDQSIQAGYMAGKVGEGIEAAGKNAGGAMNGFIGMGMAMNAGGNIMGGYQQAAAQQQAQQVQQPQQPQQQAGGWKCECGNQNTGKFCSNCGKPQPENTAGWVCSCGQSNTGKFCSNCGKPHEVKCPKCGYTPEGTAPKFCPECGTKL